MSEKEYAASLKSNGMRCNCDLDNWEPEVATGHSWVCRIHVATIEARRSGNLHVGFASSALLQSSPSQSSEERT